MTIEVFVIVSGKKGGSIKINWLMESQSLSLDI